MKDSLKVYIEKVYVNQGIHSLLYCKDNCRILGICENDKRMNFMEGNPKKIRERMKKCAYEECLINKKFKRTYNIKGKMYIQLIKVKDNEKVLILKGKTIIAVYQYGVYFIEGLSVEVKKEVLHGLYQFGYINADEFAKILNKIEIK